METKVILWRRLDCPGHESARLSRDGPGWGLAGTAVFAHADVPCRLDYRVVCDAGWRTRSAAVSGWVGDRVVEVEVSADAHGVWRLNGEERPEVAGCDDVDLNFSPSTNLLPIRRLGLPVGAGAEVRAAWLRFPSFLLEPLDLVYRREDERTYAYASGGGRFTAELVVDESGFVLVYPGLCEAEAGG